MYMYTCYIQNFKTVRKTIYARTFLFTNTYIIINLFYRIQCKLDKNTNLIVLILWQEAENVHDSEKSGA